MDLLSVHNKRVVDLSAKEIEDVLDRRNGHAFCSVLRQAPDMRCHQDLVELQQRMIPRHRFCREDVKACGAHLSGRQTIDKRVLVDRGLEGLSNL